MGGPIELSRGPGSGWAASVHGPSNKNDQHDQCECDSVTYLVTHKHSERDL